MEDAGFKVDRSNWEWTTSAPKQSSGKKQAMLWYLTQTTLPPTRTVMGPPVAIQKHAIAFKKKYRKVKTVKGRLIATVKNDVRSPNAIVALALKNPIVKEKAQRARLL